MSIGFFRIRDDGHFNKHYGENNDFVARSGYSTLPYSLGWSNQFGPPPFNELVLADVYSSLANPGYLSLYQIEASGLGSQPAHVKYGPVNNIYKISIGGLTNLNTAGSCYDCSKLNRDYYVSIDGQSSTDEPLSQTANLAASNVEWFGYTCDDDLPLLYCGHLNNNASISVGQVVAGGPKLATLYLNQYPNTSGNIYLNCMIWSGESGLPYQAVFQKDFGYVDFTQSGLIERRPYMLEGPFVLSPLMSGDIFGNEHKSAGINNFKLHSSTWNMRDNRCDYSNATCTISPLKSGPYDYSNVKMFFASGEHKSYVDSISIKSCKDVRGSGLMGDNTTNTIIHQLPISFTLTINNVTNTVTNDRCISCNDYFIEPVKLKLLESDTGLYAANGVYLSTAQYFWSGRRSFAFNDSIGLNVLGYPEYNICSYGCDRSAHIALANGLDYITQVPCIDTIEFDITESGNVVSNVLTINKVEAILKFVKYSLYVDTSNVRVEGPTFTKTICDNSTAIKCDKYSGALGVSGLIDCLSTSTYNNFTYNHNDFKYYSFLGELIANVNPQTSGYFRTASIGNHCNFTNANVILRPDTGNGDCVSYKSCRPCTNGKRPQTIISVFSHPTFGSVTHISTLNKTGNCFYYGGTRAPVGSIYRPSSYTGFAVLASGWYVSAGVVELSGASLTHVWRPSTCFSSSPIVHMPCPDANQIPVKFADDIGTNTHGQMTCNSNSITVTTSGEWERADLDYNTSKTYFNISIEITDFIREY